MRKRKWIYIQKPQCYCIKCNLCGGTNIEWSEYEHMIWCFDCKKDVPGTGGVFDGPIPLGASRLLGMNFDRIELKTGQRLYMTRWGGKMKHKFIYCHRKPKPEYDPQYIEAE